MNNLDHIEKDKALTPAENERAARENICPNGLGYNAKRNGKDRIIKRYPIISHKVGPQRD